MTLGGTSQRAWVVVGRVQGVGFRWFVYRTAARLGLAGWVRNLPDGRVEVVARGSADALDELLADLKTGPRSASVERVESVACQHEVTETMTFQIK